MAKLNAWTESLVQKLTELWPEFTASVIADKFGMTRNAIIGKATRLGLDNDRATRPAAAKRKKSEQPAPSAPRVRRRMGPLKSSKLSVDAPLPFVPRIVDTSPRHITFAELTDDVCKFECSGQDNASEFRFCGHDSIEGKPYCAAHCRLAYLPPTKPRKTSYFFQAA